MPNFSVILAAAGKSQRFRGERRPDEDVAASTVLDKKPFVALDGKAVWIHSAERFRRRNDVGEIILVVSPDDDTLVKNQFSEPIERLDVTVVIGGNQRSDSVRLALDAVGSEADFIAIHDAARPCIDDPLIDRVFAAAIRYGLAVPTTPVHSTVKRSEDGISIMQTVDRSQLYLSQTPQVFDATLLREMFASKAALTFTDESQLAEMLGHTVAMSPGSPWNIKITTAEDLELAALFLNRPST